MTRLEIVTSIALVIVASNILPTNFQIAFAQNSSDWHFSYSVGKFADSNSLKPDQVFVISYRVLNGSIDSFRSPSREISANVSTNSIDGGVLQIEFPRSYPYSNVQNSSVDNLIFLAKSGTESEHVVAGDAITKNCFFDISIPFKGNATIRVLSIASPNNSTFHGDEVPSGCMPETSVANVKVRSDGTITPPSQTRAGVAPLDVVCPDNMELILQPLSGKPYCAPHAIILRLTQWTIVAPSDNRAVTLPPILPPRVSAFIDGLSNTYKTNDTVQFSVRVSSHGASDDCGDLVLLAEGQKSGMPEFTPLSTWHLSLPCTIHSQNGPTAKFDYTLPENGSMSFVPKFTGEYRLELNMSANNITSGTSENFNVTETGG